MKAKEMRDLEDSELAKQIGDAAQRGVRPALRQRHRRTRRTPPASARAKRDLARALTVARERELTALRHESN